MVRSMSMIGCVAVLMSASVVYAAGLSSWDQQQLKRIDQAIAKSKRAAERARPDAFKSTRDVKRWRALAARGEQYYKRIQDKSNEQVVARRKAIDAHKAWLEQLIASKQGSAAATSKKFGDTEARYKLAYATCWKPLPLKRDFTVEKVKAWNTRMVKMKQACPEHQKYFSALIKEHPTAVTSNIKILERFLRVAFDRTYKQALSTTASEISLSYGPWNDNVGYIEKFNAKTDPHKFQEDDVARRYKSLEDALALIDLFEQIDVAVFNKQGGSRAADKKKYKAAMTLLKKKEQVALDATKMCRPKGARKYAKIAVKKLRREQKGIKIVKAVTNGKLRKESQSKVFERKGKLYKMVAKWDQVQVCTAEKEGDKYYLYYTTLYYKRSDVPGATLKTWLQMERFKGNRILKKNIR